MVPYICICSLSVLLKCSLSGWLHPHAICSKCAAALDRQKVKARSIGLAPSPAAPLAAAASSLPEWSLPPSVVVPPPDRRLAAVGATREQAKRASRVLLQAVIENYSDRPRDMEEGDDDDNDSEESSDGLDAPQQQQQQPVSAAKKLGLEEGKKAAARKSLSKAVLASLGDISAAAKQMEKAYVAPLAADEGLVERLAQQDDKQPQQRPQPQSSSESLAVDLSALEAVLGRSSGLPSAAALDQAAAVPLGRVETDDMQRREAAAGMALELGEEHGFELGEEVRSSDVDAALKAEIDSLDAAVSGGTKDADALLMAEINSLDSAVAAKLEADPVKHLGEALVQAVALPSNPEASEAMHDDLLQVRRVCGLVLRRLMPGHRCWAT